VPEADSATQTDAFLNRPPTPRFVPPKSGTDAATQIENGELFDFDMEVEPLLEVLVGKTLEQVRGLQFSRYVDQEDDDSSTAPYTAKGHQKVYAIPFGQIVLHPLEGILQVNQQPPLPGCRH